MKLKSKIMLNSSMTFIFIILISSIFIYSTNQVKSENQKNNIVNQISKNVFELTLITNNYNQEITESAKNQWLLNYEENSRLLNSNLFENEERDFLNQILEKHIEIKNLFLQISPLNSIELNNNIVSQLSTKYEIISSESLQLSDSLREKTEKSQGIILKLMILTSIIILTSGFFISYKISKSILSPIKYIMQGTKEIERGNYRTRININTGDEIEELGNSFNKTMEALENIDAKRQELEHAKTEFLSVTSHELRSPMTPMRAQLQMLKEEYFGRLTPKQYTSVDIVLRNTERLDKIIMDLLEVSRIEAARLKFNFVKTELGSHIRRTIDEMSTFILEKNIQLLPTIEKLPKFDCDPDRIMQVLRNLLENAIKFSEKNNRIIIKANKSGNFILFSVKDFGIGISENSKKRLFEPFYQGEETIYRKYGGTGLGLSICKGIVESQGGRIWFESNKGKGTEFFFTFPLKPVKEIKPIKLMFSASIDDEFKILNILKEFLGPMAITEINILKREGLSYEKLIKYISYLKNKNVLDENQVLEFTKKVGEVFGKYSEVIKPELQSLIDIANKKEKSKIMMQNIITLTHKIYGEIAIKKANTIKGLKVDYNGKIISLNKEKDDLILKSLGHIYINLLGDITRFLKTKEPLNNKES